MVFWTPQSPLPSTNPHQIRYSLKLEMISEEEVQQTLEILKQGLSPELEKWSLPMEVEFLAHLPNPATDPLALVFLEEELNQWTPDRIQVRVERMAPAR
ncbi:hypothetical protein [Pontibacter sp. G13]|uniref:hypothetical protein n=1 Tax=Pontibacter sp. G13 TaxID=3074898 RepID=UPI00288BB85D|nr:hypothetical protein [Pontibacter sp. G13]WNJ16976.1 hypothetical protein RJD25_19150 [Pontibacter sp. G13]